MKKIAVIAFLLVCGRAFSDYPEKIRIHGSILDYQWAHSQNRIAVLFMDNNENYFIYTFKTDPFEILYKFYIPEKYNPRQVSWNNNDSLLVFTSRLSNSDNLFQLEPETGGIRQFMPGEPRIGYIRDILFSGHDLWSITWEVDGAIDIFIYSGSNLMTSTDTNGSFIETLNWKKEILYTRSNIDGRDYFNGNSHGGGIALKTYSIDPYTHKVSSSSEYHKDLINTSSDGSYYLNIIQDVYINIFEIWLY